MVNKNYQHCTIELVLLHSNQCLCRRLLATAGSAEFVRRRRRRLAEKKSAAAMTALKAAVFCCCGVNYLNILFDLLWSEFRSSVLIKTQDISFAFMYKRHDLKVSLRLTVLCRKRLESKCDCLFLNVLYDIAQSLIKFYVIIFFRILFRGCGVLTPKAPSCHVRLHHANNCSTAPSL